MSGDYKVQTEEDVKEGDMAHLEVLFQHTPRRSDENHGNYGPE
jgi:hypothetical protein